MSKRVFVHLVVGEVPDHMTDEDFEKQVPALFSASMVMQPLCKATATRMVKGIEWHRVVEKLGAILTPFLVK